MVATVELQDSMAEAAHFQSPFRRGNGCYSVGGDELLLAEAFSPLFVGAMVATLKLSVPFPVS